MQAGTDVVNKSDGYRVLVGRYSGDAGRSGYRL